MFKLFLQKEYLFIYTFDIFTLNFIETKNKIT